MVYYDVHTFCIKVGGLNTELTNNIRKIKKTIHQQVFIKRFTHCKRKRPAYGTLCYFVWVETSSFWKKKTLTEN